MKKLIIAAMFLVFGFASCEETNKKDVKTSDSDTAVLKENAH